MFLRVGKQMSTYAIPIILILLVLSGCGGSSEASLNDPLNNYSRKARGSVVLAPRPVPAQYQGMAIQQLEGLSTTITYSEILGKETDKVYAGQEESSFSVGADAAAKPGTGSNFDPNIADNIMEYEGALIFSEGFVQTVYPSSEAGLFTLWFCSRQETAVDFSSRAGTDCVDPLFLLYSLERGPELKKGDLVQVASIIVGTREYTFRRNISGGDRARWIVPSVSVVRAKFIESVS